MNSGVCEVCPKYCSTVEVFVRSIVEFVVVIIDFKAYR
jgi:hypothetical protein